MQMTLQQAFDQVRARIPQAQLIGDPATVLQRVHTDTRTVQSGDFFVALKGERFDANDFLAQAHAAGAVAALAHEGYLAPSGLAGIEVPDTTLAFGAMAAEWRAQWSLPLIAITGSNGKTTVTQMVASILQAYAGSDALSTRGNLNNAIGVPQTLLRLAACHRMAVVELGMNHPGEIAYLADLARPTVALVNNAQREHLEFMRTVEAVAQENGAVLLALPDDGVAVFPSDDVYTPLWRAGAGARRVMTFSDSDAQADVHGQAQWRDLAWTLHMHTPDGEVSTRLHLAGQHNVRNALAAAACALAAGVPLSAVAAGLAAFEPVQGRSKAFRLMSAVGHTIEAVDDTYNANPDSVRAAIDVLAALPAPRYLVLGDMGEVGVQGVLLHEEVGQYAKSQGIDHLLLLGDLAQHAAPVFGDHAVHFADMAALQQVVLDALPVMGSVLVKGSRFMKMERVVAAMQATVAEK